MIKFGNPLGYVKGLLSHPKEPPGFIHGGGLSKGFNISLIGTIQLNIKFIQM